MLGPLASEFFRSLAEPLGLAADDAAEILAARAAELACTCQIRVPIAPGPDPAEHDDSCGWLALLAAVEGPEAE